MRSGDVSSKTVKQSCTAEPLLHENVVLMVLLLPRIPGNTDDGEPNDLPTRNDNPAGGVGHVGWFHGCGDPFWNTRRKHCVVPCATTKPLSVPPAANGG
jgi:hypothetical protein